MAKIPENLPKNADIKIIKKLNHNSDNYKVYLFLARGNSTTVAEARAGEFPLTQDLTSRIQDLKAKFGVPISSMRVEKDGVLKRYKRYWMSGANDALDNSLLCSEGGVS